MTMNRTFSDASQPSLPVTGAASAKSTTTAAPPLPEPFDWIAGRRVAPARALGTFLVDPNDGTRLEEQRATSPEALETALATAADAHARGVWSGRTPEERADALDRMATSLEGRASAMAHADARTTGVVITTTSLLASLVPHILRGAARELRAGILRSTLDGAHGGVEVLREPWGPAAVIAPWNAPSAIATHKVASALAAGCPVVLKPSEWAPHACRLLAEAAAEADLPPGVFQLVHGGAETGAKLVADARVAAVSFTGGLVGGRAVARACAESLKPVQLELGGNNPLVVLEDADLDAASDGIVAALTTLNGQWCRALGRLLVHESHKATLLEKVLARLATVRLGSSLDRSSGMGPLVHEAHAQSVRDAVAALVRLGGKALASTPLPALPGAFVAPTLVTGLDVHAAAHEIFGPVATVHTFSSDEEAVGQANASPFGLAAYVFGREERALRVARRVRAGSIKVNGVTLFGLHPLAPRPAWGLSGLGDEGTRETLLFFTGTRVVGVAQTPNQEARR
jgi:phenylacetaldehyde dehydrogenase